MGVSRSGALVLAYLMICRGLSLMEAVTALRLTRDIGPNWGFLEQLRQLDVGLQSKESDANEEPFTDVNWKDAQQTSESFLASPHIFLKTKREKWSSYLKFCSQIWSLQWPSHLSTRLKFSSWQWRNTSRLLNYLLSYWHSVHTGGFTLANRESFVIKGLRALQEDRVCVTLMSGVVALLPKNIMLNTQREQLHVSTSGFMPTVKETLPLAHTHTLIVICWCAAPEEKAQTSETKVCYVPFLVLSYNWIITKI